MSERPGLLDTLVELAVYAPVGLAVTAAEELPELIAKGRSRIEPQLGTAQLLGRLVVAEGRRRACNLGGFGASPEPAPPTPDDAPPDESEPPPSAATRSDESGGAGAAGGAAESAGPATGRAAAKKAAPRPPKRTAPSTRASARVPRVESLAIPGYDALSASQVVARLAGLSQAELSAVGRYEAATRGRRTILSRVSQLETS